MLKDCAVSRISPKTKLIFCIFVFVTFIWLALGGVYIQSVYKYVGGGHPSSPVSTRLVPSYTWINVPRFVAIETGGGPHALSFSFHFPATSDYTRARIDKAQAILNDGTVVDLLEGQPAEVAFEDRKSPRVEFQRVVYTHFLEAEYDCKRKCDLPNEVGRMVTIQIAGVLIDGDGSEKAFDERYIYKCIHTSYWGLAMVAYNYAT